MGHLQLQLKFYNIVTEKGGYVALNSYINSSTIVEITCAIGHKWSAQPSMINYGRWYPECANVSPKAAVEKYNEILRRREALAADLYVNSDTHIRIQCKQGHIWITKPATVNSDKHWCPECVNRFPKAAAESYYKIVKERGGIPIDAYVNSENKN